VDLWDRIRKWLPQRPEFTDPPAPVPAASAAGEPAWVVLQDGLNSQAVEEFEASLQRLLQEGKVNLVVDLAAVSHISSKAWGVMVACLQQARQLNGDLRIANMQDHIKRLFTLSGLSNIFNLYNDSVEEPFDQNF